MVRSVPKLLGIQEGVVYGPNVMVYSGLQEFCSLTASWFVAKPNPGLQVA